MIEAILYLTCITANCSEGPHLVVPIKVSERFCAVQAQQYAALGWPAYHLEKYECAHTGNWTPIPIRKRIFLETGATSGKRHKETFESACCEQTSALSAAAAHRS
jgi:hypothetical protein